MHEKGVEAYPLHWPAGKTRSERLAVSPFSTGFGKARDAVLAEVRRLGGRDVILSTNVPLNKSDGLPRANFTPDDPGVAVYFTYKGNRLSFACDRWNVVRDNLWAIAKTIEALRGIARWGTGEMIDAAFRGFRALPAPAAPKPWHATLGFNGFGARTLAEAELRYRELARDAHPDRGGSHERMAELNAAIAAARAELGGAV